jgi:hypothetical protein
MTKRGTGLARGACRPNFEQITAELDGVKNKQAVAPLDLNMHQKSIVKKEVDTLIDI